MDAARHYKTLDFGHPEAVQAVIKGLEQWSQMIPQRSVHADGVPESANKWGLAPERVILRSLSSRLVAVGLAPLASRIGSEMADLLQNSGVLDESPPGSYTEERMVITVQLQVKALIDLLLMVKLVNDSTQQPQRKKPGPQPSQDPVADREWMEAWAAVKGRGGMRLKEFCKFKGIEPQDFVRAQDRFRKQAMKASA